jgi:hypothetical protein
MTTGRLYSRPVFLLPQPVLKTHSSPASCRAPAAERAAATRGAYPLQARLPHTRCLHCPVSHRYPAKLQRHDKQCSRFLPVSGCTKKDSSGYLLHATSRQATLKKTLFRHSILSACRGSASFFRSHLVRQRIGPPAAETGWPRRSAHGLSTAQPLQYTSMHSRAVRGTRMQRSRFLRSSSGACSLPTGITAPVQITGSG